MLSSLLIRGFRGQSEISICLGGSTGIIGKNGSGKTHILEALHIASGGSFAYLQSPRDEGSFFEIGYISDVGRKSFSIEREGGKDIHRVQGAKSSGVKYRESLPFRTVFVSPFDMNLFYFAPSVRRDYMDNILARTFAQFTSVRRKYELTMRQRNALLKKIREGEAERRDLDFWDRAFCEGANLYSLYRQKYRDFIEEHISLIGGFLPEYTLRFGYESRLDIYDGDDRVLEKYFLENRERDILTGHTHIGPHLDDFGFFIGRNGEEMGSHLFLSRGENKVLLLALKQIEILFLKKYRNVPIILLFDDVFAELDETHADATIERFDVDQVILTSQRALPKNEKWQDFSCINL